MAIYVGIDPGKNGFSAEIDSETGAFRGASQQPLVSKEKGDTFDTSEMRRLILRWREEGVQLVVLEDLQPMGGKGTPQTHFYQGAGYAYWKGMLAALDVRVLLCKKNHLKKTLGIKTPSRIPKEAELGKKATKADKAAWAKRDRARLSKYQKQVKAEAIKVCTSYYPSVDLKRNSRCEGPDDNKAEALLYALFASKADVRVGA
jgi:hypothetical protein